MNFEELKLPNLGILTAEIPSDIFETLKQEVDRQSSFVVPIKEKVKAYNKELAGQLEKEYIFDLPKNFETFLSEFYSEYDKYFNAFDGAKIRNIQSWLNIQQKNEYNPNHKHTGSLSWVVWVKIPYSLTDEDTMNNTKRANVRTNSRFEFTFTTLSGEITTHRLDIDKTWEGKIVLFPSNLMHTVYPFFTSDEYRISIAGNIF